MKICRIIPAFQETLEYSEHYIAKELHDLGHDTTFVTSDKNLSEWSQHISSTPTPGTSLYADRIPVHRLHSIIFLDKVFIVNLPRLISIIRSDVDVIHLTGLAVPVTITVLALRQLLGRKTNKVVVSDHTDSRSHRRSGRAATCYYYLMRCLLRPLSHQIDRIITFNGLSRDILCHRFGVSPEKFTIIPLGFDSKVFRNLRQQRAASTVTVGYAGKIDELKRVERIFKAIATSQYRHQITCKIAGMPKADSDYTRMLRQHAADRDIEAEFFPLLTKPDLAEFYNSIDIAIYPGGISITTIEANGCGTPIILYRSIRDLDHRVAHGRGVLFNTDEELATTLDDFIGRLRNGTIDRNHIAEATKATNSWNQISRMYLRIYKGTD